MIFIFLIVILVIALGLYALVNGKRFSFSPKIDHRPQPHAGATVLSREQMAERWDLIKMTAGQGENGLKSAINDADKLLDQAMRQRGFAGETMADRLKKAEHLLSDKEAVWSAHKLRNAIAHEVHFDVVTTRGHFAIQAFERALKDLGAL